MSDSEQDYDWFGPEAATFGDRVAGARDVAGMSQAELSRRLGIKIATLRAWEDDRSEPRANKLQMLSGLLNVSLSWLISGQGPGLDAPDETPTPDQDVMALLIELRTVKTDLAKSADRLSRLEKQLRKAMTQV